MVQITGKYKRTSEKRYEDFLSKLGLNFMIRKAAMSSTPTMEITKTGNKWKIVTATKLRNVILEFEMVRFKILTPKLRHQGPSVGWEKNYPGLINDVYSP